MDQQHVLLREIDQTDQLIASLSAEGAAFINQLHDVGMTIRPFPPDPLFEAAYDFQSRVFMCPVGGSLAKRFNWRVHEGAHALQGVSAPRTTGKLVAGKRFGFDPESLVRFTRAAELNAYSLQVYFNAVAAQKTGDPSFFSCNDDNEGKSISFTEHPLVKRLVARQLPPADTARIFARRFYSLGKTITVGAPLSGLNFHVTNGNAYDLLTLSRYIVQVEQIGAIKNPAAIDRTEIATLLNSFMTIDPDGRLEREIAGPLRLNQNNRELLQEIKAVMHPR